MRPYKLFNYYAATVIEPAAVPIAELLVIVDTVEVPASLIVPLFNPVALVPITSTSSSLVAALAAALAAVFAACVAALEAALPLAAD